jgi:o-succinylbenzoate synthase
VAAVIELRLCNANVPLAASNAHTAWHARASTLLELRVDGLCGFGEACPLPDYSKESTNEAQTWLQALPVARLGTIAAATTAQQLLRELDPILDSAPPSARFAVEAAALDVLGQRLGVPVWKLLATAQAALERLPIEPVSCRLFSVWDANYEATFDELVAAGVTSLKVKIGRDSEQEVNKLTALLRRTAAPPALRLDANRSLPSDTWEQQLAPFAALGPEFIEEPCAVAGLGRPRPLPFPLAFDESLIDSSGAASAVVDAWLECRAVRVLVLKPMLVGSFERCCAWARRAAAAGADLVVSHVFDGSVARAAYRQLSIALGSRRFAAGLGAHAGLALWAGDFESSHVPSYPGMGLLRKQRRAAQQ